MQAAALENGLHQLLLNCVADTHALLALRAFQPSQAAPASDVAQRTHAGPKAARSAGRVVTASGKGPRRGRTLSQGLRTTHQGASKGQHSRDTQPGPAWSR